MCGQHQACEAGLASHDATRELASIVAQQNQPLANHLQIAEIGLPEGVCYHSLFVEFVGEFRVNQLVLGGLQPSGCARRLGDKATF